MCLGAQLFDRYTVANSLTSTHYTVPGGITPPALRSRTSDFHTISHLGQIHGPVLGRWWKPPQTLELKMHHMQIPAMTGQRSERQLQINAAQCTCTCSPLQRRVLRRQLRFAIVCTATAPCLPVGQLGCVYVIRLLLPPHGTARLTMRDSSYPRYVLHSF